MSLGNGEKITALVAPAVVFTLLCWANCSIIETAEWQASGKPESAAPNRVPHSAPKHLSAVGIGIAVTSSVFGVTLLQPGPLAIAGLLSGAALWILGVYREAISNRFVSATADLALCSPLVILAFLWLQ